MNPKMNKEIAAYCKKVKKLLVCQYSLKCAFISDFKSRIQDYIEEAGSDTVNIEDIIRQFGTPDVVAESFCNIGDITELRKKARKYTLYKIVTIIAITALILASVLLIVLLTKDNHYTITDELIIKILRMN